MRKSRWKRKQEILYVMWAMMPKTDLSMHRVAFWIGMKPSDHLLKILHEMKGEGLLSNKVVPHRPNINKFLWSLTDDGVRRAYVGWQVKVKSWG